MWQRVCPGIGSQSTSRETGDQHLSLLWRLAQNKSELTALVTPVRLAKLVVLQQRHEELYELLRKNPARLRGWESNLRK